MLQIRSLSFERDGRVLFEDLQFSWGAVKSGLVGANGVGKSTLARILAGLENLTQGEVLRAGSVAFFAQSEPRPDGATLAEYLEPIWSSPEILNHEWARRWCEALDLERPTSQLSGGEWMRARLLKTFANQAAFLILDEPTNNLDRNSKDDLREFIKNVNQGLILISHDRDLLREMDELVEFTARGLRRFSGSFDDFWQDREDRRLRQRQELGEAHRRNRQGQLHAQEQRERQAKRMREGARKGADLGIPKIILGAMKRNAQKTQAKIHLEQDEKIRRHREELQEAVSAMDLDPFLRLDFATAAPPAGKIFFLAQDFNPQFFGAEYPLWPEPQSFTMKARERWRIRGPNGSGKSTLLKALQAIATGSESESPNAKIGIQAPGLKSFRQTCVTLDQDQTSLAVGQNSRDLDRQDMPGCGSKLSDAGINGARIGGAGDSCSLLEILTRMQEPQNNGSRPRTQTRTQTPRSMEDLRNELAFYGFRGDQVRQKVATFSGGERLRAALAQIFLSGPIPDVILLDEPTNDLDFQSWDLLGKALQNFQGLLVIASHDEDFCKNLGIMHELHLEKRPGQK